MTEIATIQANGLAFGYLEAGSGPLALCLHGFPDSAYTWRHLLPALADAGYHAVAPFLRGYAPTEVPKDGAYQVGALAADANALHEAFGGDADAVLVGHDWGAAATYAAVAHAPERWRRSVALSLPPFGALLSTFFDYAQLKRSFYVFLFQTPLAEAAVSTGDMAFLDGLWADWSPGYDAARDVAYAKECLRDPEHLAAAIGYYRAMLDPSLHVPAYAAEQESAERVGERPTLYLHGAADGCLDVGLARDVEGWLPPGSRSRIVADAGHFVQLERPAEVGRLVLEWLAAN
ncbi:alpha/beta hydrolase [Actinoallomurus purpureus]|uniref:alpha/beta fold hydrolase n=1 Tax=Actinoallomurus purpureus TaxID=478114 RepID=UPI002091E9B8|nr:alpha/beta hydrolase [Actinoallomurus purpureus]MCO6008897.1 alpha/beta hydrolase [Actinoallomurus purpureus]